MTTPTARTSMANLIARVRTLVSEATTDQVSDLSIQEALDRTRIEVRPPTSCIPSPSYLPGGILSFDTFFAPDALKDWEDDVVLTRANFTPITPSISENLVGKWTFSATDFPPAGVYPPVFIVGKSYDPYMAGAHVCDMLLATIKDKFDYHNPARAQFFFSQKIANLQALKQQLLNSARIEAVSAYRSDESLPGMGGLGW